MCLHNEVLFILTKEENSGLGTVALGERLPGVSEALSPVTHRAGMAMQPSDTSTWEVAAEGWLGLNETLIYQGARGD